MDRIKGLREYVKGRVYLEALGIPAGTEVEYTLLAQGEYNINYVFTHPVTGKKLILRVNTGSQMHLEHQIVYEYEALQAIERSGRTPRALYVDADDLQLNHGILVMEYLEGKPLDYHRDLELAAECLADIHSIKMSGQTHLLSPDNPLQAILEECGQMMAVYNQYLPGNKETSERIARMLEKGKKKSELQGSYSGYRCCINTELNSGNFLVNGIGKPNYLIDWEKPLLGDPAQDLGHFLAPTTTFWKTDTILSEQKMCQFVKEYEKSVNGRFDVSNLQERVDLFIPITCLRGITWCAMAWTEYRQPDRLIKNKFTFHKIEAYLEREFLERIEKQYL